ncbi:TIGR04083 family peptide-modifying radical SAM enzyme [Methanosarcina sp.]|uniref:TIGR04083 family peptide-modifying radical SAM enzyme n=1 Tax=Methanosarcina sp. TaxID=2213 RepID=UPI0029887479|nr:TIGR04083 family peptide-modifying radical SAM enzyme [Methanosarcina sp.]MDW5550833.1 TIGR04083 family peptide-modifying radical SAM enzyme [Methanosarcina sp.]MDW5554655.1 TIGR04083 family peptide-modifying radical SAM enzyme [Methanosarcina sp.]MDW5560442.1 TIGR04083 family peptide-modifying radical SAM enzyme [Methanosarcina sp.]
MPFHVMLIPTLGCPANCSYCWSSEEKSPIMSIETIKEVVEWLKTFRGDSVTFTFHGGEPLLAGAEFYREALPLLVEGLSPRRIAFAIQTNLWKMTPEIAEIFAEYGVPIGSSLDGPKELNDLQRGKGYYDKTMRGYEIAREHGLNVRFITTFTSHSVKQKEEIFNFYLEKGLTLKLHPCLPSLKDDNPERWTLAPEEYGELLIYLLDKYLENLGRIEVMNIDHLCKCVFTGHGTVCTYVDCMGDTFAVGPDGDIYPCYRFIGMPEYVMGNVYDRPSMADLAQSEAWKKMHKFKEYVDIACSKCAHIKYCRGGCPYNAIVPTSGEIEGVDPHCLAYKMIFDEINKRVNEEMFGGSDMDSMFSPSSMRPSKSGIMSLMLKKL